MMDRQLWIALDAAGTLFEPAEPVARVYARCFAARGHAVAEGGWNHAFRTAFSKTPDPIYPAPGAGEAVEREWWRTVVANAAEATGFDTDSGHFNGIFEELFHHYAAGDAWKLFPETKGVLESFRDEGVKMAVVSNFDSRLGRVLDELGISSFFAHVLTSADVGARKPDPAILRKTLELTGADPSGFCLAGDSETADGGAANACGIAFFHIARPTRDLTDFKKWHGSGFFRE